MLGHRERPESRLFRKNALDSDQQLHMTRVEQWLIRLPQRQHLSVSFRRLKEMISAKGKVVIGNFSDNNASRPYMECIGSWVLIHRSADDLLRLAKEAGFSPSRTHIIADGTNVNLFLIAENDP